MKPTKTKRPFSGPNRAIVGIQTSISMPIPSINEIVVSESVIKILPPRMPPNAVPTQKGSNVPRMKYCHLEISIDELAPSWTRVCRGIRSEGGKMKAIMAIKINPPAVPATAPTNAVTIEAIESPENNQKFIPGMPRKGSFMVSSIVPR